MRRVAVLLLVSALLHGVAAEDSDPGAGEDDEEMIMHMNKTNFDELIQKFERVLVYFVVPGKDDYKREFSKTSKMLMAEELATKAGKVDASVHPELAERYNITNFPALKYFIKGKFSKDYDGKKKDTDTMTLWLKNKEDPPVKEYKEDDIQQFLDEVEEDEYALVAHVKKKSVRAKMYFRIVEEELREWDIAKLKFAVVWLPKDADPKADAKLYIHRPGILEPDPEDLDFTGAVWNDEKLLWWVKNCSYPTVGKKFTRNQYAPQSMDAMGWTAAIVGVTDDSTEKDNKEERDEPLKPKLEEAMAPWAVEHPEWKFVIAEIEKLEDHEHELLNLKLGDEPRLIVLGVDKKKYHLVGEEDMLDDEKVRQFLSDAKAGKLKPHFKSAEKPEEEFDADGSLILTGNTFEELVLDEEDKDVFVEFYAPWCKHCQKLAPEWKRLNDQAKEAGWEDRGVVLAKMDMGANECEEDVPSFPRLILYPAVETDNKFKRKQMFSGDRTAEALFEFVVENAVNLQSDDDDGEEKTSITKKQRRKGSNMVERELDKKKKAAEEL